jgi:hypothetical protein
MKGLQRLYAERYGSAEEKIAAADPKVREEKIAAAEGGKIASAGFWDELSKLVVSDQERLKK